MRALDRLGQYKDLGLFIIRLGLGIMFMLHGVPKLMGGPELWYKLGGAMQELGVYSIPTFWGFMAAAAEGLGGLFLVLGFCFRPACLFMALTMAVAVKKHLGGGEGLMAASHALEDGIVFLGLLFVGPGNFAIERR